MTSHCTIRPFLRMKSALFFLLVSLSLFAPAACSSDPSEETQDEDLSSQEQGPDPFGDPGEGEEMGDPEDM